jgi:uncharacterized membrane protein YphA (DoxX/SURF4 family)
VKWPRARSTIPCSIAAFAAVLLSVRHALAHERWVAHALKHPVNKAYFRAMTGEVLGYSLMSTLVVALVLAGWYLVAVPLVEAITPATAEDRLAEARRPRWLRTIRLAFRFFLDGDVESPVLAKLERGSAWLFAKLLAAVLALGVYQNWFIMPSYPLDGSAGPSARIGLVLRGVEAILALWIASGLFYRALGVTLFAVYAFLCVSYGVAAVDSIPVLGSAFYYYYYSGREVNPRQVAGLRVCLGAGFVLLGLVNKVYFAELFVGVGDNYPQLVESARHMMPGLTREAWSLTTALGEMTFGLLLLLGVFDKITCIALTLIFGQLMFVFGLSEIAHVYFIAGFLLLLFHSPPGTVLDGLVFRAHVGLWRLHGGRVSPYVFVASVAIVAAGAATMLMFVPLLVTIQVLPSVLGTGAASMGPASVALAGCP